MNIGIKNATKKHTIPGKANKPKYFFNVFSISFPFLNFNILKVSQKYLWPTFVLFFNYIALKKNYLDKAFSLAQASIPVAFTTLQSSFPSKY